MTRRHAIILSLAIVGFFLSGPADAAPMKSKTGVSGQSVTKNEMPQKLTRMMAWIDSLSRKDMEGRYRHIEARTVAGVRGFTTDTPKDKGSFLFGNLVADLNVASLIGDKGMVLRNMTAILEGLAALGAPPPLVTSVRNLGDAVNKGAAPSIISAAGLPAIEPFIDDFMSREGSQTYYTFGLWVQTMRIMTFPSEKMEVEAIAKFLDQFNDAPFYLDQLKDQNLPKGVVDSLKTLSGLKAKKDLTEKDIKAAFKAADTIYQLMG